MYLTITVSRLNKLTDRPASSLPRTSRVSDSRQQTADSRQQTAESKIDRTANSRIDIRHQTANTVDSRSQSEDIETEDRV